MPQFQLQQTQEKCVNKFLVPSFSDPAKSGKKFIRLLYLSLQIGSYQSLSQMTKLPPEFFL